MKHACRAGLLSLIVLSLAGCNSMTQTSVENLTLAIRGPAPLLTVDEVNRIGRSILLVNYQQSQSTLGSPAPEQAVAEWHGLQQMLVLHNGRLIQSAGLPEDADMTQTLKADDPFVTGLLQVSDGQMVERQVDFPRRYLTGLRQTATYRRAGEERLTLMGQERQVVRIDERVRMPELGFSTTNRYWLDPASGQVLRSQQTLLPDTSPLIITLLQPDSRSQP